MIEKRKEFTEEFCKIGEEVLFCGRENWNFGS
jgi:hypothetical protein